MHAIFGSCCMPFMSPTQPLPKIELGLPEPVGALAEPGGGLAGSGERGVATVSAWRGMSWPSAFAGLVAPAREPALDQQARGTKSKVCLGQDPQELFAKRGAR